MKVFLNECCKFEELFPFKKVEIKDLWDSLREVCFLSLNPKKFDRFAHLNTFDSINNPHSPLSRLLRLEELKEDGTN